jgi:starch phosphorylase
VSLAEIIIPGSEIDQQISTGGTEASVTSNMKSAFNSSLIVGMREGANIEIGEAAGGENVFFFGAKAGQVDGLRAGSREGDLNPRLQRIADVIKYGMFGDAAEYECIWQSMENGDRCLVNADFQDDIETQMKIDLAHPDQVRWVRKYITQTANRGRFSLDRTVKQCAEQMWRIEPMPLPTAQRKRPPCADRIGSSRQLQGGCSSRHECQCRGAPLRCTARRLRQGSPHPLIKELALTVQNQLKSTFL